jgi:hypothetical protein
MDRAVSVRSALENWGARDIEHPGGTLFDHLLRTEDLLRSWGADEDLALAGLSHAAYGTDGFARALLRLDERSVLLELIGLEAEAIVYQYASCDRSHLGTRPGQIDPVSFRDRFDGRIGDLPAASLKPFMELTFANELDIAVHNDQFARDAWPILFDWLITCKALVSEAAMGAIHSFRPGRSSMSHSKDGPLST